MDKLLDRIMEYINNDQKLTNEENEIVRYGLELFLIKTVFLSFALLIGYMFRNFWECFVFTFLFSGIRSLAGGYHSSTRIRCFIMSMIMYGIVICIFKLVYAYRFITFILLALSIISIVIIWFLAPVETVNRPIEEFESKKLQKKVRIMILLESAIAIIARKINLYFIIYAAFLALIFSALLVLVGKKSAKKKV